MTEHIYEVTAQYEGERIDKFLTEQSGLNRSEVQKWIKLGKASAAGMVVKANYRLRLGETVVFSWEEKVESLPAAENIPLDILYEDEAMIVINKARGMVIHPAPGNPSGTLVNALLHHCGPSLLDVGDPARPGIVHRLDKDTSGVMVAAKTPEAYAALQEEIASHAAQRRYIALVHGQMEANHGVIRLPLGRSSKDRMKWAVDPKMGRPAVTHFKVLRYMPRYSWVECRLETGRTHQIRVHMAYIGHPVVQDPLYGWKKDHFPIAGQALHSHTLDLTHPVTGKELHFEAPLPEDMLAVLAVAEKEELR